VHVLRTLQHLGGGGPNAASSRRPFGNALCSVLAMRAVARGSPSDVVAGTAPSRRHQRTSSLSERPLHGVAFLVDDCDGLAPDLGDITFLEEMNRRSPAAAPRHPTRRILFRHRDPRPGQPPSEDEDGRDRARSLPQSVAPLSSATVARTALNRSLTGGEVDGGCDVRRPRYRSPT